jgi:hypothetical protein
MNILSIDPGSSAKGALAMSLFLRGQWAAGQVLALPKNLAAACTAARAAAVNLVGIWPLDFVVVEEMRARPQRASGKAWSEVAQLLELQAIAAYVAGSFNCPVRYLTVNQWKGSLPKEICHARLRDLVFAADEWARIEACAKQYGGRGHNLLDSAGIGAAALGRFRV